MDQMNKELLICLICGFMIGFMIAGLINFYIIGGMIGSDYFFFDWSNMDFGLCAY